MAGPERSKDVRFDQVLEGETGVVGIGALDDGLEKPGVVLPPSSSPED